MNGAVRSVARMLSDPRRFSRLVAAFALIAAPCSCSRAWRRRRGRTSTRPPPTTTRSPRIRSRRRRRGCCCTSASCCCCRRRSGSCTWRAAPRRSSRTSVGCSRSAVWPTLPGLLVTDFYDLALAEALPRAESVTDLRRGADGVGADRALPHRRFPGHHRHDRAGLRRVARRGRPALDSALLIAAGWLVPMAAPRSAWPCPSPACCSLTAGLGWIGLTVARMDDQTWAERAFVRAKAYA